MLRRDALRVHEWHDRVGLPSTTKLIIMHFGTFCYTGTGDDKNVEREARVRISHSGHLVVVSHRHLGMPHLHGCGAESKIDLQ